MHNMCLTCKKSPKSCIYDCFVVALPSLKTFGRLLVHRAETNEAVEQDIANLIVSMCAEINEWSKQPV